MVCIEFDDKSRRPANVEDVVSANVFEYNRVSDVTVSKIAGSSG